MVRSLACLLALALSSLAAADETTEISLPGVVVSRIPLKKARGQDGGTQVEGWNACIRPCYPNSSASVAVRLTAGRGASGQQIGVVRGFSPLATPEQTFAQQRITCVLTITDPDGEELWSHQRLVQMRSSGFVHEEDAQRELREEMEESFQRLVSSDQFIDEGLPTRLLGNLDKIIAGSSSLEYGREGPPPPPPGP